MLHTLTHHSIVTFVLFRSMYNYSFNHFKIILDNNYKNYLSLNRIRGGLTTNKKKITVINCR